jgi:hypothetical protein
LGQEPKYLEINNLHFYIDFTIHRDRYQKERDYSEDLGVDGRTLFEWILEKWEVVDWMDQAQNRDQWRAVVNTVVNLRVP